MFQVWLKLHPTAWHRASNLRGCEAFLLVPEVSPRSKTLAVPEFPAYRHFVDMVERVRYAQFIILFFANQKLKEWITPPHG
jgi:hypothetical protein